MFRLRHFLAGFGSSLLLLLGLAHTAASAGDWLVVTNLSTAQTFTNTDNPFRPDRALAIAHDDPRGIIVLYQFGVERWNHAGQREWSARYVEADFGGLNNVAVDAQGNTFVSGHLHFTATLGDLSMTNNSLVSGPNGHVQSFIAKLDPTGHGLWYRLYEAAGPRISSLAVDSAGAVFFAGSNSGKNGQSRLGTLLISESEFAGAVAGKIGADGVPQWFRGFPQFANNRSTCEADGITVDDTGVYLSGLALSIQFGPLQFQGFGAGASRWIGKLNFGGEPQWIKGAGGTASQGSRLQSGGGYRWLLHVRDRVVQSWSTNGTLLTSINAVPSSQGDSASVIQFSVNGEGQPILAGNAKAPVTVGSTVLNPGVNRPLLWFGQWDATGVFRRARLLATTTNSNPNSGGGDTVDMSAGAANPAGDLYFAGSFLNGARILGRNFGPPTNSFRSDGFPGAALLVKLHQPALAPGVTLQNDPIITADTGASVVLAVAVEGPEPITFQWRQNGIPFAGATNKVLQFPAIQRTNAGIWDCVVSHPVAEILSPPTQITVRPPFTIQTQPTDFLVLGSGVSVGGTNIGRAGLNTLTQSGRKVTCTITNTTSAQFPLGGVFTVSFNGVNYLFPDGGALGTHAGRFISSVIGSEINSLFLQNFSAPNVAASMSLFGDGQFNLHYEIADPAGCCASGSYTLGGGNAVAQFLVRTTRFVPAGGYQWQKDGQSIAGATNATLSFNPAQATDAGVYRCVVTDQGYTEISSEARLVFPDAAPLSPPALAWAPFTSAANGLSLPAWPAGYILQRTVTLQPVQWETYATQPPVVIPVSEAEAFFRLRTAP